MEIEPRPNRSEKIAVMSAIRDLVEDHREEILEEAGVEDFEINVDTGTIPPRFDVWGVE